MNDELRRSVRLRLQQDGVHVGVRLRAAGQCLQCLRPTDLAAVGGDRGVVRLILRLEGQDRQPAMYEPSDQGGEQPRIAEVRPGPLQTQSSHSEYGKASWWGRGGQFGV